MRSKMIDEEKLCKIKSSLVEARSSFEGTEESDDGWAFFNYLWKKLKTEGFRVTRENGCSKYVLYFVDCPFVLKMDSIDSDGNRGGECEREVELYEKAVELGLEKFFPKTKLFCYLGDIPIVIQEKVDFADCNIPSAKFYEIERISRSALHQKLCYKIMDYLRENADFHVRNISSRWLSACVRLYGKKTVFELEKFIIDNRINDMHGNNVGWLNSKPVILDFSGYWRSSD